MNEPAPPRYDDASLAQVLPAALAALTGSDNSFGLPQAEAVCLLLVDGLGLDALNEPEAAPLRELASVRDSIDAGFPATTAVSLATLGTGSPPGTHGIVGYAVALPDRSGLHQHLRWSQPVDPEAWQPVPTVFDRAVASGVAVTTVSKAQFAGSGLTRAALRGGVFRGADQPAARIAATVAALDRGPALVYDYISDLDYAGHGFGPRSPAWRSALADVAAEVTELAGRLPTGAMLLVTGDHGMVNVSERDRVDLEAVPQLGQDVVLIGGEPRARHIYCADGRADAVAEVWAEVLGDRAWVRTKTQAITAGWFGPEVSHDAAQRIGDVVVAARGNYALCLPRAEPNETNLAGMHGSLTAVEQQVPLLLAT